MQRRRKHSGRLSAGALVALVVGMTIWLYSCGGKEQQAEQDSGPVVTIATQEKLASVLKSSHEQLVVIDFYADWCAPCRILSPMLERIALSYRNKAAFYKVNVDKLPAAASSFGVRGIPHVAFVKGGTQQEAITGLRAQTVYEEAIQRLSN